MTTTGQDDLAARKRALLRRRLQEAGLAGAGSEEIPPRPADAAIPLSFAQQRMWFLQQLDPASPAYNVCLAITLRGPVDVRALATAFRQLADRHEILRTRYLSEDGGPPVQVVDPEPQVELPVVDLRDLPADERARRTEHLARETSAAPFDLARDHSIRASLIHRAAEDFALVLTVHHIAWDGGTFNALSADLSALYRQALTSEPAGLDPLPAQYADVAVWQRDKWTDEHLRDDLQYWARELTPPADPLPLPTDGQRRALPSERGGRRFHDIAPAVTEQITAFCQRNGVTPFMVLHAGFAALLHRYTGSADVPIGSATMNRDVAGLEKLIGNFGNTLVLRADLSGDPTFEELVLRVRQVCSEGYAHQDVPFDKLVDELRPERHQGRSVFFDVMLLFLTQGLQGPDLPGVTAEWETVHNDTCQFDLALEAFMTGGQLRVEATYRDELFEPGTIDKLLGHLEALLAAGVAEPGRRVSGIDVLSAEERDLILRRWTDTAEPEEPTTLLHLVEDQARRTPDGTAVELGEAVLTFGELNARSNQLARRIAVLGAGPERCVGIHLERSIEMVVGLVAVLKTGAAFVPLEPSWPSQRIAEVCRNARIGVVLTAPGAAGDFAGTGATAVEVDLRDPSLRARDEHDLGVEVRPENLAYVIYTSGSTGAPKGAMIRHRAIAHRLVWQQGVLGGFGADDAALFKAPLGFDISINEIFLPLVTGGRLVIAEPGGERDTEYLLSTISRHRVTFVYIVSSMLDLLLELDDFGGRARSLRHVWCGGEVLTPELFDRFRELSPAVLYHGYGPAEATIGVSHVVYRSNEIRSAISIGHPNSNTRLHVLDRALQPVPVGVHGELYAGGVYLGRGYVNDPARTAQHFVADPFGPPGSRLYRTGDLARWRPDGQLEFLGRVDNQIKIRGMRVELEEIEAVLEQHGGVRRAVVVVLEDAPGVKRLVAYCLAADGRDGDEDLVSDLRRWAQGRLPAHMVPQAAVLLPEFPLMPSGKVDRKRLPAPEREAPEPSREPGNDRESVLCGLFAELLGLAAVGAEDDFFELGGDSIVSVQLVSRARKAGLILTPRHVFEHPTPVGLAAVAGEERAAEADSDEEALGVAELTPIMWWTRAGDGTFGGLNQAVSLVAPAGLTERTLVRTLSSAFDRHDVLRAKLDKHQLVVPPAGAVDARDVLRHVPGLPDADVLAAEAAAARDRLDPERGRMVEAVWFDAGDHERGRLLLVAHHLVIDWVSWSVLSADLDEGWRAARSGRPVPDRRSGTSFRRWTRVLEQVARSHAADLDRWVDILDGPSENLTERPLEPERDVVGTLRHAEVELGPDRAEPLLSVLPAAYHAGVPEVLLTGLAVAATGVAAAGPDGLVIGVEGHGREEEIAEGIDLSTTVGWHTTFYPVRIGLGEIDPGEAEGGGAATAAALKRVKEQVRQVPNRGLTYGLLRHLNQEAAQVLSALPEPRIAFNYLGRFTTPGGHPWELSAETAAFRLPPADDHPVAAAVDLNALAVEQDEGPRLRITASWPAAVVDRRAVDDLLARWERALGALAEHAARSGAGGHTPSDLSLVSLTQEDIDELEDDGE